MSDLNRRDFIKTGTAAVGAALAFDAFAPDAPPTGESACILLCLVGGPSHLDTLDPKPDAPAEVRGPFGTIPTAIPGVRLSEHLPLTAARLGRVTLVRSVFHDADPIHEAGQQLVQTGRLHRGGKEYPHVGSVASALLGPARDGLPPFVVLPGAIENTGVSVSHGQGPGWLGTRHAPFVLTCAPTRDDVRAEARRLAGDEWAEAADRAFDLARESESLRDRYGRNAFGQSCLLARRLVESGVRVVAVNMFDTVFDRVTWDCHADGGSLPTTLADYAGTLCPMFDRAYAALLDDLADRGLLGTTFVMAAGEFGRTPRINPRGGRDHWPGCWSALLAGGGVRGGRVIGASDAHGARPADRPVAAAELAATAYRALGIDASSRPGGPDGRPLPLTEASPLAEAFA